MTEIINGAWWLELSPDGLWVAYGNGSVVVRNLATGQDYPLTPEGVAEYRCGWWAPGVVAIQRQLDGNHRSLRIVDCATLVSTDLNVPTWWAEFRVYNGHIYAAHDGAWSGEPGKWRMFLDDHEILPRPDEKPNGGPNFDGWHSVSSDMAHDWQQHIRDLSGAIVQVLPVTPTRAFGHTQALNGRCWFLADSGVITDDQGRDYPHAPGYTTGNLTEHAGEILAWSGLGYDIYDAEGHVVTWGSVAVGRPLADYGNAQAPGIVIEGVWSGNLQVVVGPNGYIASGSSSGGPHIPAGQGTIGTAAFDQPRTVFVPPAKPNTPAALPEIVIGPQRACYIDDMSGQGYGNSSGVGGPAQTQRIFEDARFLTPEFEPYLIAFVHGPFEGSLLDVTIPMAQRLKKPVILAYDGHSDVDLQPHRKALEAAGLTIWEGRTTYPNPPDEAPQAMYDRMALTLMADSRPQALIAPGYRVHGRNEADIAQFNLKTNDLKERFAHVMQVAVFGMDRPPIQQWCRDFWRAVTVKTPIPFVPPPPIVVIPPTSQPEPEPPKVGKWAKFLIALRKFFNRRHR